MAQAARSVDATALRVARKHAQRLLGHRGIDDSSLEDLVTYCTAANGAGVGSADALEIGSGLVRNGYAPADISAYSLDEFLDALDEDDIGSSIAGIHEFLRLRDSEPSPIVLGTLRYERTPPVREGPILIGLDEQRSQVLDLVEKLFCYDTQEMRNFEYSGQRGLLLYGPPGTGKSSLCSLIVSEAAGLSARSQVPLRHDSFRPHEYSKWVGESSKNLQRKFDYLCDPSGVGILVLEEVDLLVESRDEHASAGGKQVLSVLMQNLSGFDASGYSNLLLVGTSNRPEKIDAALSRRFTHRVEVPYFSSQDHYAALARSRLSWANQEVIGVLARAGFDAGVSPSRMNDLCSAVDAVRRGPVDRSLFDLPMSEREDARKKQYRGVSLAQVRSFVDAYAL